jgi:RNA polymerase sigma-70 factor (ECF subfamily)
VPLSAADRSLLQRCLSHDAGAWREFVDRFLGLIYHVIQSTTQLRSNPLSPEDVEDLAAEILLQVVAKDFAVLRRFQGRSSLAAYLTVIARRVCIHELAKRAGVSSLPPPAPKPAALANHDVEQPAAGDSDQEIKEAVQRLLERLPPRDRQVVRMFHIEGKTYDEIAAELGISRNSIGPILTRARDQLRQDGAMS